MSDGGRVMWDGGRIEYVHGIDGVYVCYRGRSNNFKGGGVQLLTRDNLFLKKKISKFSWRQYTIYSGMHCFWYVCPVPPSHGAFHTANFNYKFDL